MQIGERTFDLGVFVKCPHPEMIEAIGIAGLDFAVVDMEHTPLSPRRSAWCALSSAKYCAASSASCISSIPSSRADSSGGAAGVSLRSAVAFS